MDNQGPRGVFAADDITVVTAMLADVHIRVARVVADDVPGKAPRFAHCVWHLESDVYASDELSYIEQSIRVEGVKEEFTYSCSSCGLDWMETGGCGPTCDGEVPTCFVYDATKRTVIADKRTAQEALSSRKGLGKLYRD